MGRQQSDLAGAGQGDTPEGDHAFGLSSGAPESPTWTVTTQEVLGLGWAIFHDEDPDED